MQQIQQELQEIAIENLEKVESLEMGQVIKFIRSK